MSISGRHQVVQQGIDRGAEVEEDRGHQVDVLGQRV